MKAYIDPDKCVGCGACISVCRQKAIHMMSGWKSQINQEKCIGCGECVRLCHKHAPMLIKESES